MKNIKNLLINLQKIQLSPPENPEQVEYYLKNNLPITFFSWKIFPIKIVGSDVIFSDRFNLIEAEKYIDQERQFLLLLIKTGVNFRYLKIIPNELTKMFWQKSSISKSSTFSYQVQEYFQKIYPRVEVIQITDFLEDRQNAALYNGVYQRVYNSFDQNYISPLVNQGKFKKEVATRSTCYTTKPLDMKQSKELARKAFSLFAAETALLFKLQETNVLPNLILLAGQRSIDTYKYEFFNPKNRPILPKLFVI